MKRYLENDDSGSGSDAELDSESDPDGGGVGEGGSATARGDENAGSWVGCWFLNPLGRELQEAPDGSQGGGSRGAADVRGDRASRVLRPSAVTRARRSFARTCYG